MQEEKITLSYEYGGRKFTYKLESPTLTMLMANVVDFTRAVGYQSGSWDDVINKIIDGCLPDEGYEIFDWAMDIFIEGE